MDCSTISRTAALLVWLLTPTYVYSFQQAEEAPDTIFGIVMEARSGTADVPVCLCDAATGLPLVKETYQPFAWDKSQSHDIAQKMAIVVTDDKGRFRFTNVPAGNYRLVAQKWIGPYKGIFEQHGTVIQLMGSADEIQVPRPQEYYESLVVLRPPGTGIVRFDQDVGNNETFMFLSTSAPTFDPVLGLSAMGPSFFQHLIGVNRMPLGKTTVIGVPDVPLYAFFFAPDNLPGFATLEVPASKTGLVSMPPEPFVAGWSDGRKTPPKKLADLRELLDTHSLTVDELLNIPKLSFATYEEYEARMQELSQELSRVIELSEGKSARVGDLLAVERYRQLQRD